MYAPKKQPKENKKVTVSNSVTQKKSHVKQGFGFVDNRPEAIAQRKLQGLINSPTDAVQRKASLEPGRKANNTGLPDNLKSGMEILSGYNLDHVRVHYNSSRPATVQAHAYAQGSDIHLSSGQQKHLPHELGHVVQQAQGRVSATTRVNGMAVNDNTGLEKEADVMGSKALQMKVEVEKPNEITSHAGRQESRAVANSVAQKKSSKATQGFGFVDNRPEYIAQRKLLEISNSSQTKQELQLESIVDNNLWPLQRYSEQESTSSGDVEAVWAARETMGIAIKSKMGHNVAVDYNDDSNYARSSKGGHAENFVFSAFAIKRKKKGDLNIISERQPCGDCEENLRHLEEIADPDLEVSVDYFIKYEEGAGGDELWDYYQENLPEEESDEI